MYLLLERVLFCELVWIYFVYLYLICIKNVIELLDF